MSPSLDSPRLKLERAKEHLEVIEREIERFLDDDPYALIEECDLQDGSHVFRMKVYAQPAGSLRLLVGECLYNLRSSLDHLAWQLALLTTPTPRDNTAFLIYRTGSSWKRNKGKIGDLPQRAQDIMHGFQPYKSPDNNWLYQLNRLCNDDKHRTITLLGYVLAGSSIKVRSESNIDIRTRGNPVRDLSQRFQATEYDALPRHHRVVSKDNAIIIEVIPDVPYTEMYIEADSSFAVSFGPEVAFSGNVAHTLLGYHGLIRDTVFNKFAGFF